MAKRKRDVPVLFWVSAEELELIHQKMQQYGTENLSAYLRKITHQCSLLADPAGRCCFAAPALLSKKD